MSINCSLNDISEFEDIVNDALNSSKTAIEKLIEAYNVTAESVNELISYFNEIKRQIDNDVSDYNFVFESNQNRIDTLHDYIEQESYRLQGADQNSAQSIQRRINEYSNEISLIQQKQRRLNEIMDKINEHSRIIQDNINKLKRLSDKLSSSPLNSARSSYASFKNVGNKARDNAKNAYGAMLNMEKELNRLPGVELNGGKTLRIISGNYLISMASSFTQTRQNFQSFEAENGVNTRNYGNVIQDEVSRNSIEFCKESTAKIIENHSEFDFYAEKLRNAANYLGSYELNKI